MMFFVILFYAIYGKSCVDIDDFRKKAPGRLNTIAHGFYNTVLYYTKYIVVLSFS